MSMGMPPMYYAVLPTPPDAGASWFTFSYVCFFAAVLLAFVGLGLTLS